MSTCMILMTITVFIRYLRWTRVHMTQDIQGLSIFRYTRHTYDNNCIYKVPKMSSFTCFGVRHYQFITIEFTYLVQVSLGHLSLPAFMGRGDLFYPVRLEVHSLIKMQRKSHKYNTKKKE